MSKLILEVTNDASKLGDVTDFLDALRRSVVTNQKQIRIEQDRDGKIIDISIHINGKTAGEPEQPTDDVDDVDDVDDGDESDGDENPVGPGGL